MLKIVEEVHWARTVEASFCRIRGKWGTLKEFHKLRVLDIDLHILLDLHNGQQALLRKLPAGALSSVTIGLNCPTRSRTSLYCNTLRSLRDGVFTGDKRKFALKW